LPHILARGLALLLLGLGLLSLRADAANTHGTPDEARERQAWFGDGGGPYITAGCLPAVPSSSLTLAAFACTGYVRGSSNELVYVSQDAATVTLANTTGVHWVALHRDTSTAVSSWTRRAGSHYLFRQVTAQPADPSGGLVVAQVTVAGGVVTAVADVRRPASYARAGVFDVTDPLYGAIDDDTTNARTAITAAIAAASQRGGTVYFPYTRTGSYYVSGTAGTKSLPVPVAGAAYATANQNLPYQFYVESVTGLRFKGDGVTIRSDYASGGEMFLLNGVRDFVWDGIRLQSVTGNFDASRIPQTVGMNGLAFTATTQDAERILIQNVRCQNVYTCLYVFGDGGGTYRLRGMTIENLLHATGYYTLAFHDNGDNVTARTVRGYDINRGYFVYGIQNHDVQLAITEGGANFAGVNIKAYDYNTSNIHLQVRMARTTTSNKLHLESQHNVAAQPTPGVVRNISIDYDESGYAGGGGINFGYYQDDVLQATSSAKVFDNITLRGVFENDITTGTTFTGNGRVKLNIEDRVSLAGTPSILNGKGFYTTARSTYTPVLKIGGSTTGITYSAQSGEYYEIGNLVFGNVRLTLSSKGAQTGVVTVTLPRSVGAYTANNIVPSVLAYANFTGLTGVVQAFINNATSDYLTLVQSDATGTATFNQANLTDTSDMLITFAYPK